jgi:hypothetical protein
MHAACIPCRRSSAGALVQPRAGSCSTSAVQRVASRSPAPRSRRHVSLWSRYDGQPPPVQVPLSLRGTLASHLAARAYPQHMAASDARRRGSEARRGWLRPSRKPHLLRSLPSLLLTNRACNRAPQWRPGWRRGHVCRCRYVLIGRAPQHGRGCELRRHGTAGLRSDGPGAASWRGWTRKV